MNRFTQQGSRTYPGIEQLSDSEYYEILSSDRRRTVLKILEEQTPPVELETLAAAVAARENDAGAVSEERIKQVATTLHHAHLPKMAGFDVVDYDADATRVESCL